MASCALGVSTPSTSNLNSYASGSFTPAANDLLAVLVHRQCGTDDLAPTLSDSQSLGFTLIASGLGGSASGDRWFLFLANALAAASAMTVTFNDAAVTPSGATIIVIRVSGMTKTGATAAKQTAKNENQAAATTPNVTFGAAALTGNPTILALGNHTSPSTMTQPTGWTEQVDTGFSTPTSGQEVATRDSGFTGTLITWASNSASKWGIFAVELDASASGGIQVITGSSNGVATVTGTIVATKVLAGSSNGRATVSGAVVATKVLAGESDGRAAVAGAVVATKVLAGQSNGVATVTGALTNVAGSGPGDDNPRLRVGYGT